MHLTEGDIRAYQDHELETNTQEQVRAHLASCARCRGKAEDLLARARRVEDRLATLTSEPIQAPISIRSARQRLDARLNRTEKEHETMWSKFFSRLSRPAWASLAILVILISSLAFSPVRGLAQSFLGLFRVQQITVVQVDTEQISGSLGSSDLLQKMLSKDAKFESNGEPKKVANAAEASSLAGFSVRLPTSIEGAPALNVESGGSGTFQVDLQQIQALLKEIGRNDIQLPSDLNGAEVKVEIPAGVTASYGNCGFNVDAARQAKSEAVQGTPMPRLTNCTTLIQIPSPSISAPAGLDLEKLGQIYLEVLGMGPEEAAHFAQNVDWTSTFVIPIPRYGATYQDVQVDGVTGTLIQRNANSRSGEYMLLWLKDGLIYALTGPGDASAALQIANSLQ
jgi:hypothetical protein